MILPIKPPCLLPDQGTVTLTHTEPWSGRGRSRWEFAADLRLAGWFKDVDDVRALRDYVGKPPPGYRITETQYTMDRAAGTLSIRVRAEEMT